MQEDAYEILKYHHHHMLKCGRGITVSNLHRMAHVCAIYCGERTLVYVLGHCTNLFICIGEVNLQPYLRSHYVQANLILVQEWHNILYGVIIPFMRINCGAQQAGFLWNTQHRCCLVSLNQLPPSCLCIACDLLHELYLHGVGTLWQVVMVLLILINEQYVVVNTTHLEATPLVLHS